MVMAVMPTAVSLIREVSTGHGALRDLNILFIGLVVK